ncbi:MAG: MBL fold metallo-hydrolase [Rhodospirillales bacterium]
MERINANAWYEVRTVGDGVTYIGEPHIKEFYRCNVWHVRGRDRDMLVDSGMGVVSLREHVPLVTEKPCVAVASHTHFDHVGCHHEFEERLVHPAEADIMAQPTRANTLAEDYVRDDIFTALPPEPYTSTEYAVKRAPATRLIDEGDIVDLGDRVFEVLHTPGHSVGEIMLWEKATGVLFSGDMIYDGPLIDGDVPTYVEQMKRIYDLPVRVVHGGHFPSFDGDRYRELIRAYVAEKEGQR